MTPAPYETTNKTSQAAAVSCDEVTLELAQFNLGLTIEWVKHAELKATTILTFATVLLGVSMTVLPAATRVGLELVHRQQYFWLIAMVIGQIVSIAFLIYSIRMALLVVRPKLDRSSGRHSWFYFMSMASISAEDYVTYCRSMTKQQVRAQLCDQVYNNSVVASRKFAEVVVSLRCLVAAGVIGFAAATPVLVYDAVLAAGKT